MVAVRGINGFVRAEVAVTNPVWGNRAVRLALLLSVAGVFSVGGFGVRAGAQDMPAMPQGPPMPAIPQMAQPSMPGAQSDGSQGAGFVGAWCVGGDPTQQASISNNGVMLNLTNESGSTSIGNLQGANQIVAPGWQFVTGTLSGGQINWSNGTFWTRCGGGGGGRRRASSLNGNWYPQGNRSLSCSIQQHRGNLTLQNENGARATGSFTGRSRITTNWQGTTIVGTISRDRNRIDWSNGTYWIRYRLYAQ
jgi:hypothetical protein